MKLFSILFLIYCLQIPSYAKYVSDTKYSSDDGWLFITRFCFLTDNGTMSYTLTYDSTQGYIDILFYYDLPDVWASVINDMSTCAERRKALSLFGNQSLTLSPGSYGCSKILVSGNYIKCDFNNFPFHASIPLWWFIVLSNCDSTNFGLFYEFTLRNGPVGEFFREHYSADERMICPISIAFLLLYFILCGISIAFIFQLKLLNKLHNTFISFTVSIFLMFIHFILTFAAYASYGKNGVFLTGLSFIADGFYVFSYVFFVGMLLSLGFGYTIVVGKRPIWVVIAITLFQIAYFFVYIALLIYEAVVFDERLVLYRYQSPPGIGLLVIQICAWVFFVGACIFTFTVNKKRRLLFTGLLILYTLWFWALPVTILVCLYQVGDDSRRQIAFGCQSVVSFLGHVVYMLMSFPAQCNQCMPYTQEVNRIADVTITQTMEEALGEENADGNFVSFADFYSTMTPEQLQRMTDIFRTEKDFGSHPIQTDSSVVDSNVDEETKDFYADRASASGFRENVRERQRF